MIQVCQDSVSVIPMRPSKLLADSLSRVYVRRIFSFAKADEADRKLSEAD